MPPPIFILFWNKYVWLRKPSDILCHIRRSFIIIIYYVVFNRRVAGLRWSYPTKWQREADPDVDDDGMGLEVYVGIRRCFLFKIPYIWVFYVHHRYSAVVFSFNTFIITLDAKD